MYCTYTHHKNKKRSCTIHITMTLPQTIDNIFQNTEKNANYKSSIEDKDFNCIKKHLLIT